MELLVTEMPTNAVLHTAGESSVRVTLDAPGDPVGSGDGGLLQVEVFDTDPLPPVPRDTGRDVLDCPGGWGMELVAALADEWRWA